MLIERDHRGMASGSDSDVQLIEDGPRRGPSDRGSTHSSPIRKRNVCLERDGVPQERPAQTRASAPLTHPDTPHREDLYARKRKERQGKLGEHPPKRNRAAEARHSNEDLDVVEVRESTENDSAFHGRASSHQNQPRKRTSQRLREKKGDEFNFTAMKLDRERREGRKNSTEKRSPSRQDLSEGPWHLGQGDPIVLDDDEERHRSSSSKVGVEAPKEGKKRHWDRTDAEKRKRASEPDNDVVRVEEDDDGTEGEDDEIEESKDSNAVDAPYTGSTHLIFEFPPGQRGKIRVTEEERGRLRQKKYLNDSLIDFYIKYHETDIERRAHELRFTATFFSSFFFGRLRRTEPIDYEGVKGWTKNVDIFSKQFVFVPICESYHWSLIIVANLDKLQQLVDNRKEVSQSSTDVPRIIYLDSLDPKRGTEFGDTMRQYLVEEWLAKRLGSETNAATRKATSASFKKIIQILRPNVPIQTNEYDCGLYVLNSFEMFLNNTDGLRDKLLSGYRDVRDAYSHIEVALLRRSIINLMDILEKQWANERVASGQNPFRAFHEDANESTIFEFVANRSGEDKDFTRYVNNEATTEQVATLDAHEGREDRLKTPAMREVNVNLGEPMDEDG